MALFGGGDLLLEGSGLGVRDEAVAEGEGDHREQDQHFHGGPLSCLDTRIQEGRQGDKPGEVTERVVFRKNHRDNFSGVFRCQCVE